MALTVSAQYWCSNPNTSAVCHLLYIQTINTDAFFFFFYCGINVAYAMLGLSRGGQQVGKCKEMFNKAVMLLVELASLQVKLMYCLEQCI